MISINKHDAGRIGWTAQEQRNRGDAGERGRTRERNERASKQEKGLKIAR
jgi:hypothetical protein